MGDIAIRVDRVGKQYRIGRAEGRSGYKTLREVVSNAAAHPLRSFRKHGGSPQGTIWALDRVSIEIKKGEVVGIIGRNGAGKSTLLKVLSRITEPTRGTIDIFGRVGSLLEVGTGFHPELTGRENILLNGAILGMRRREIERRFEEIVAFAEIGKFVDTPVKHYSSGMYLRLAFAVAAHLEPEILLIDEVLAVGDAEFQKKCLGKMGEIAQEGRTVLFVSHNMGAISKLCNGAILLADGHVEATGTPDECITRYLTGNTAAESRTIRDSISYISSDIEVHEILVNDQPGAVVHLPSNQQDLSIGISGALHNKMRMDIEARFYDFQGTPLGFFSPGHMRGEADCYPPGPFSLRRVVTLPKITRGDYSMSIFLADPARSYWMRAPNAVQLRAHGNTTATGLVVDYSKGNGWIFLP